LLATAGERVTSDPEQEVTSVNASLFRRLPGFVLVGVIGFVVDATILTLLMTGPGLDHYSSRAISFTAAVTVTWYLNRRWVFDRRAVTMRGREYSAYVLVQIVGAVINLAVFVLVIELVPGLVKTPVVPLAVGAIAGLLFNFTASSTLVFRNNESRQ